MVKLLKTLIPNSIRELSKDILGHNFIKNYYGTNYKKKVLISYINKPFISKYAPVHTNLHEALAIADIFHELEYSVDLINYTRKINYETSFYDVVFGLGEAVEYALRKRKRTEKSPFVIWHGTGASPFYSNPTTINRLAFSYHEAGVLFFDSTRFIEKIYPLSYVFSDLIILYGNEFTKNTYKHHTYSAIETITPTTYFTYTPKQKTPISHKNYFWFGSAGAVHKGLDLLIHFFSRHPEINLHICGDVAKETEFYNFYKTAISQSTNIHYHGFVDIQSNQFKTLMEIGTFSILPSCSEGIATSVLTTMANGGMIPIVTKNTGIDIMDFGIAIEDITLAGIQKAIQYSQNLSPEEINSLSKRILSYTRENYTIENFSKNLKNILVKYLQNNVIKSKSNH